MKSKKNVILTGAQTGGHLYPMLAVGLQLIEMGVNVTIVRSGEKIENVILDKVAIPTEILRVGKLKGMNIFKRIKGIFSLPSAFMSAVGMIRRLKPDVVVGFGGFTSGPLVLSASLLGIKTAICEENSIPGYTNKILSRFTEKVFTAYEETQRYLHTNHQVIRTGTPVRPEIASLKRPTRERATNILVFGGSQGSSFLNSHIPELMGVIRETIPDLSVIHQTGLGKTEEVEKEYRRLDIRAKVMEYISDMAWAYEWADFIISRAGAGTIAEITVLGIPSLLIPFALAADNHQVANAAPLAKMGGALMVEEKDFEKDKVARNVIEVLTDPEKLKRMSEVAKSWSKPDATLKIAQEILAMTQM